MKRNRWVGFLCFFYGLLFLTGCVTPNAVDGSECPCPDGFLCCQDRCLPAPSCQNGQLVCDAQTGGVRCVCDCAEGYLCCQEECVAAPACETGILECAPDRAEALCQLCGNGLVDEGEVCDGGPRKEGDLADDIWTQEKRCKRDCSGYAPHCGDGEPDVYEECDHAGESATCDASCTWTVQLSTGQYHTCSLIQGKILCWGSNEDGQTGAGGMPGIGDVPEEMGAHLGTVDLGRASGTIAKVVASPFGGSFGGPGGRTCTVHTDGSLRCFGGNEHAELGLGHRESIGDDAGEMGESLPAVDLGFGRTVLQLATGGSHSCALLDNRRIKCWGDNGWGEVGIEGNRNPGDRPGEMGDNLRPIDLGSSAEGAPLVPVALALGMQHSCALLDSGRVKCWGRNDGGSLGSRSSLQTHGIRLETMGNFLPEVELPPGERAVALATGFHHTCALLSSQRLACWGWDSGYLRGADDAAALVLTADLGSQNPPVEVVAGEFHTCARLLDGRVICWGRNDQGQLGLGHARPVWLAVQPRPDELPYVDLGTGQRAVRLSGGRNHTCAVLEQGRLKCWGVNDRGQLGVGDLKVRGDEAGEMGDSLHFVDLGPGVEATDVAAGASHTCALLPDRTIKCWGDDEVGQLGGQGRVELERNRRRGDEPSEMGPGLVPVFPLSFPRAVQVSSGSGHNCVLFADGSIRCFGNNGSGQLGLGDRTSRGRQQPIAQSGVEPLLLGTDLRVRRLSLGVYRSCAVFENGKVKCWGDDATGHQADTMGDRLPFVDLGGPVVDMAVGPGHACAILDNRQLKCWGENDSGQLGLGDKQKRGDRPGDLGLALSFIPLGTGAEVVSVAVASGKSCAVLRTPERQGIKCWGDTYQDSAQARQSIGDEPGEMGDALAFLELGAEGKPISVVLSESRACALLDTGNVLCWGENYWGQLGLGHLEFVPPPAGTVALEHYVVDLGGKAVALSAGDGHTCAVLEDRAIKCWGSNAFGELGQGDRRSRGSKPEDMGPNLPPVKVGFSR